VAKPLSVLGAIVSGCLLGCASWQPCPYGVSGQIVGVDSAVPAQRKRLVEELGSALHPLGFSGPESVPHIEPEQILFSLTRGSRISGDHLTVVIALDSMQLSIRDHVNVRETPLDRDTITAVQTHLATAFHATIDFGRVTRCYI